VSWASSTIPNAMAAIHYFDIGSTATDALSSLHDFVTAVSTSAGLLLVSWAANGLWYEDGTP
jgi:hypothetical protein